MAGAEGRNPDLPVRIASALVVVAIAIGAIWLGGWFWAAFVMVVAAGVLYEWRALVRAMPGGPLRAILWTIGGILYIAPAAAMLLMLREAEGGFAKVFFLVALVAAIDIGAYFTGRSIGGPKIAPRISPSKTWAGLLGGVLGASALLYLWAGLGGVNLAWWQVLALGALAAIIAQAGDFFESWMKRRAGVKDSGRLIPGHGGLFDRVDGLIAVGFVLALLTLGGVL